MVDLLYSGSGVFVLCTIGESDRDCIFELYTRVDLCDRIFSSGVLDHKMEIMVGGAARYIV